MVKTSTPSEFEMRYIFHFQMLCTKGAAILQSINVEGAANELINMFVVCNKRVDEDNDDEDESSRPEGEQQEMEGMGGDIVFFYCC